MADAKKCDRCNEYYDRNAITEKPYQVRKLLGGTYKELDLCDDCIVKLNLLMANISGTIQT